MWLGKALMQAAEPLTTSFSRFANDSLKIFNGKKTLPK